MTDTNITATPLKFFEFRQNNSGGSFVFDKDAGISVHVWVQAIDAEDANRRAERIGLYFDGASDCSCCGDRWYSQWRDDQGEEDPDFEAETKSDFFRHWAPEDTPEAYVHYADGRIEGLLVSPGKGKKATLADN